MKQTKKYYRKTNSFIFVTRAERGGGNIMVSHLDNHQHRRRHQPFNSNFNSNFIKKQFARRSDEDDLYLSF